MSPRVWFYTSLFRSSHFLHQVTREEAGLWARAKARGLVRKHVLGGYIQQQRQSLVILLPSAISPEESDSMPAKKKGKGKKKGGKKKPKLTKEERAKLKLDKACSLITDQKDVYQNFLDRMDRWLATNKLKAKQLYQRFDKNGDGVLSFDEFKAGMLDLDAPCNAIELEVLARRLDKDGNGTIDYREFSKGLNFSTGENAASADPPSLVTRQALCHPGCSMGHWRDHIERHPRYIRVYFRSITFDHLKSYPGHFNSVFLSHTSIHSLTKFVCDELTLSTTTLLLYNEKTKDALALNPSRTLEDYGIAGRTREDPDEMTLYYDYKTEFHDCSILSADYYFIK